MAQIFIAREKMKFSNGVIGWRPGGAFVEYSEDED